jgi:antitoxin (DNA-binding transcriptional repressor) of toxin-antitoxin stability system
MTRISSQDIATQLPAILSRVAQGEEFVVTEHGEAVARIVPAPATANQSPSSSTWRNQFDTWMQAVDARAGRYPADFALADSRESFYNGRGT